jgi:O-antigen/teichoic acid export membrane protein
LIDRISKVLVIRIIGAVLFVLSQIIISNLLGSEGFGRYIFVIMIVTILSTIARYGMESPLIRYISIEKDKGNHYKIAEYFVFSHAVVFVISISIGFFLFLFNLLIGPHFKSPYNYFDIALVIPLLYFMATSIIMSQILQGMSLSHWAGLIQQAVPSGVVLIFIYFFYLDITYEITINATIIGWLIATVIGVTIYFLSIKGAAQDIRYVPRYSSSFWNSSKPMALANIMTQIYQWLVVAIGAALLSIGEVGQLGAALRISMVVSFFLGSVNMVTSPKYAVYFHNNNFEKMKFLVQNVTRVIFVFGVLIFAISTYFSQEIMSLFGDDFVDAYVLLIILMAGQLFNALTGSVGYLLLMSGHEKEMKNAVLWSFLISSVLHYFLILNYGVIGAAIATSLSVIFLNLYLSILVKEKLGFSPISLVFKFK